VVVYVNLLGVGVSIFSLKRLHRNGSPSTGTAGGISRKRGAGVCDITRDGTRGNSSRNLTCYKSLFNISFSRKYYSEI
jgi:hypothetical protein